MSKCSCEQNHHGHFLIYMCIWYLICFGGFDCTGQKHETERKIRDLESNVSRVQSSVDVAAPRTKRDISDLERQVEALTYNLGSLKSKANDQEYKINLLEKKCKKQ